MRIAILDDYQQVALASADWSAVRALGEIDVFSEHIARTEALVRVLEPYDVVVAMRERCYFDAARFGQLPRLRLLVTTGMANASIDLAAAASHGVTVCGTGGSATPTAELTWGLILALARHIPEEDQWLKLAGRSGGAALGPGGWQRSEIVDGPRTLVCWLARPSTAAPTGVVLIWGGTTGWGPVYRGLAPPLLARGLAVGLVELPGQGEPRLTHHSVLDDTFSAVLARLLDELTVVVGPWTRFALMGNSVGGLLAARATAAEPRVAACVVNGGVARPLELIRRFPRQQGHWKLMVGCDSDADLAASLESLALDPDRHRLHCPVLIFRGEADPLVTEADVATFAAACTGVRADANLLVRVPGGEHCLYNRAEDRNEILADWLILCLGVAAGPTPLPSA